MDKQINVVMSSMDYDKFSFIEGNRPVDEKGRPDLLASIKKGNLEKPIDVNETFQIIDGQNRYVIWKFLGLPILYIVHKGWKIEEVSILNSNQKNWIASDFVRSYIEQGLKAYELYKQFDDKYGFGTPVNLMLLCGGKRDGGRTYELFKTGELKITTMPFAEESARKIQDFKDIYVGYKRSKFVGALVLLFKNKNYDHKVMMNKMQYLSRKVVHCSTREDYVVLMKELYNHNYKGGYTRLE